jgi:predicted MFS family arabinose efflux permease
VTRADRARSVSVSEQTPSPASRGMLTALTGAAFLIFAQAFMIAPILPRLAQVFDTRVGLIGLAVPAYLVPYGVTSLVWGPLADRIGRRPVIIVCLVAFAGLTAATATATGASAFILWRAAAGLAASGVIPAAVALIGDVVPYNKRGHALGWLFGGMAGGMAVGSTAGALAEPVVGWATLFLIVAAAAAFAVVIVARTVPARPRLVGSEPYRAVVRGYLDLLRDSRARGAYSYVGFNAVLHSGIYTWLGLYLHQRFGLGPIGIGLALLGYGFPGFLLGPVIGRMADRFGRARLIPTGLAIGAIIAFGLATPAPLAVVAVLVTVLSLGYDLTQPLLAGIVTDLPARNGQAVALMAVTLFSGFGIGSLLFQAALGYGFVVALSSFGAAALLAAALAVPIFAGERARADALQ